LVNFTPRPLYPQQDPAYHSVRGSDWVPQPAWTFWRSEKSALCCYSNLGLSISYKYYIYIYIYIYIYVCVCVCVCVCVSVISGFRREVNENCPHLGYYAVYSSNSLPTFGDNLSVPSSRVKKFKNNFLALKDGTDRLSRNVGKAVPLYAA